MSLLSIFVYNFENKDVNIIGLESSQQFMSPFICTCTIFECDQT